MEKSNITNSLVEKYIGKANFTRKAGIAAGSIIAVGAVADLFLSSNKKKQAEKMVRRQKKQKHNERKQNESLNNEARTAAYYDMMQFNDFVQGLYSERSGSRNTYGGRRY